MPSESAPMLASPLRDGSSAAAPPPRVWSVLVAYIVVLVVPLVAFVVLVAILWVRTLLERGLPPDGEPARAIMRATVESAGMRFATSTGTVLVQLVVALSAARLSREPFRSRLALGPQRLGAIGFVVAAAGCVATSSTFDAALGALGLERGGSIVELERTLAGLSRGGLAIAVALLGIGAPVAEELFFRGYVQTRLCLRWGTWTGIFVTAALFGLAHLDWIQSSTAFLVGVYLGWLTAQSGTVAPAIAAHALNNVLWAVGTWAGLGSSLSRGAHVALLVAYVAVAIAAVTWLRPRLAASAAPTFAVSGWRHGA